MLASIFSICVFCRNIDVYLFYGQCGFASAISIAVYQIAPGLGRQPEFNAGAGELQVAVPTVVFIQGYLALLLRHQLVYR